MKQSLKSVQADMVKIELLRRGWSVADVARRAGLSEHSFSTALSASFPNVAARLKCEMAFDFSVELWSSKKTLAARKFCRDRFGADPSLLALPALRQLALRLNLPGREERNKKQELLDAVLVHLAALKAHAAASVKTDTPTSK